MPVQYMQPIVCINPQLSSTLIWHCMWAGSLSCHIENSPCNGIRHESNSNEIKNVCHIQYPQLLCAHNFLMIQWMLTVSKKALCVNYTCWFCTIQSHTSATESLILLMQLSNARRSNSDCCCSSYSSRVWDCWSALSCEAEQNNKTSMHTTEYNTGLYSWL